MTNAEYYFGATTPEEVRKAAACLRALDQAVRGPLAELQARGL
jgi:hypothetical protein